MRWKEKILVQKANYIVRHWRGELSLPVSYWINGIILGNIVIYATRLALSSFVESSKSEYAALIYWLLLYVAITLLSVWHIVGTWRSSDRYTREKGRYFWAIFTKIIIVLNFLILLMYYRVTLIPALKESYEWAIWLSDVTWDIELSEDGQEIEIFGGIGYGISDEFLEDLARRHQMYS